LAENRLHRQFKTEFRVRSGQDFSEAFDELIDLHYRRFSSMDRSTSLVGQTLTFLRIATSTLSNTGNCEIVQLRADGVTIAAVLMIRDKQRYFFFPCGFDPEFSRFSPMRLLLTETMRRGFEDLGCGIYDLGAGYERYKYDWSPVVGTNYTCCHGGTGLYAKSVAALYRIAFRHKLPPMPKANGLLNVGKDSVSESD
jgi:CelD/BcsL family acetyltransferase involved in cellulose biosynthesis